MTNKSLYLFNPKQLWARRISVFGLMLISTFLAGVKWTMSLPTDAALWLRILMIGLFILTFAWISLFFWSSLFGFIELLRHRHVPGIEWVPAHTPLTRRVALLMPVYNEAPGSVFAHLLAMAHELDKTGQASFFDIYVLSDTTKADVWVAEEALWLEAQKHMPASVRLYYRRRPKNTARKSGNIEDFCRKWGSLYESMVVLDADSLMSASTIVTMAQLMEKNPHAGIIQAPPMMVNSRSLFSRVQQFAGKIYGPIVSAGLAFWQVGDSNYWGHNAIIRVKAFMDCCGLPVLPGKAPFGGMILSHDFVEAALIRRGGWSAWLLPELKGSYEECPPTLIDYAARDRRWCQGNMQHMKILISKKLHPISRIHFTIGIMSYLSSPIWLCFLVAGLTVALGREFFPPVYFSNVRTLFPTWPIFDKIGTISLLFLSLFMLIFPKFLGLVIAIGQERGRQRLQKAWYLTKSVLVEIVLSALIAPVMMMFQSRFVFEIFTGHAVSWNAQQRDDQRTTFADALHYHWGHTLLGVVTLAVVVLYVKPLFWWMLPITAGLILSIPVSMLTSQAQIGVWAKRHHFFVIPEEVHIPEVIKKARRFAQILAPIAHQTFGVEAVVTRNDLNAAHILLLSVNGPAPAITHEQLQNAQLKLENYLNHHVPMNMTNEESVALLYHPEILERALIISKRPG